MITAVPSSGPNGEECTAELTDCAIHAPHLPLTLTGDSWCGRLVPAHLCMRSDIVTLPFVLLTPFIPCVCVCVCV